MTKEEARRLALEALEQLQGGCTDHDDGTVEAITVWCPEVIDAIKEALARPEQEPVVWMYQNKSTHEVRFQKHMRSFVDHGAWYEVPLYSEPLANQEKTSGSPKPAKTEALRLADAMEYDLDWCDEAAAELRRMHDLLGKANALCRIRAEEIERLKAQPEQEPAAWMTITPYGEEDDIWYENPEGKLLDDWTYKPLYTTPPKAQPEQKYRRGDRLVCLETDEYCVIHIAGTDRQWVKFPDTHIGVYTNEQVDQLFEKLARETDLAEPEQEPVAWINWCAATGKRTVSFECESELASQPLYEGITQNTQYHYSKFHSWFDSELHRQKYTKDHPAYLAAQEAWNAANDAAQHRINRLNAEIEAWKVRFKIAEDALVKLNGPEQKPVATMWQHGETGRTRITMPGDITDCDARWFKAADLYTTPPQPEPVIDKSAAVRIATALGWESKRKPLTDEEMKKIWYAVQNIMGWYSFQEIARAIEAAHGIKE